MRGGKCSQIDKLQICSLGKSSERTLVSEFAILAQKWTKLLHTKKGDFWMMGQGQDQQQHPAVHTELLKPGTFGQP